MPNDVDRRCPLCGRDTLVRDGADERCTDRGCTYEVRGDMTDDTPDPGGDVSSVDRRPM